MKPRHAGFVGIIGPAGLGLEAAAEENQPQRTQRRTEESQRKGSHRDQRHEEAFEEGRVDETA
jgi:hypothetical protein